MDNHNKTSSTIITEITLEDQDASLLEKKKLEIEARMKEKGKNPYRSNKFI